MDTASIKAVPLSLDTGSGFSLTEAMPTSPAQPPQARAEHDSVCGDLVGDFAWLLQTTIAGDVGSVCSVTLPSSPKESSLKAVKRLPRVEGYAPCKRPCTCRLWERVRSDDGEAYVISAASADNGSACRCLWRS